MLRSYLYNNNITIDLFLHNNRFVIRRNVRVTSDLIGQSVFISTGYVHKIIVITKIHVGHFLGEFVRTRKCNHEVKTRHRIKLYEHNARKVCISK